MFTPNGNCKDNKTERSNKFLVFNNESKHNGSSLALLFTLIIRGALNE